jgi:hypothetical protein
MYFSLSTLEKRIVYIGPAIGGVCCALRFFLTGSDGFVIINSFNSAGALPERRKRPCPELAFVSNYLGMRPDA